MRVGMPAREWMDPLIFNDTHSRTGSAAVVVVEQPGGEYMLGGDPRAFHISNNPAFYLGEDDFRANPIVGVSNLPTLVGSNNDYGFHWRFSRSFPTPQTRRRPQSTLSDVDAFVSRHVDVLQFLPSERPVRLFTLSDCTNRLTALLGSVQHAVSGSVQHVRNGVVNHGSRQISRTRDLLTGRNGVPASGKRAVSGAHVAGGGEACVAEGASMREAEITPQNRTSQIESSDWRARKLRFSAALDTRGHWSFALHEFKAEAEQQRKERRWRVTAALVQERGIAEERNRSTAEAEQWLNERRWRDIAALAQDATGQAAAAVKDMVEAALRRLTEAPSQTDVATVVAGLQFELADVQQWLRTERTFTEEYAAAAFNGAPSLAPSTATGARRAANTTPNEYTRLLEKHPGARRFLKRVAARRTAGTDPGHASDRGERLPQITEIADA